ncbi:hypothetical protein SAMN04490243_1774 [Robiginitalea myxolifaciens]|uniref:Hydrolase n=1 Tax=Robiginitalea myxolifaciens TaxID=400055 RepID=A0A1I6GVM3_9FLAO|nr:hydrolase [Robiginitalea myxolifaciens]SFR46129.1 hypothetical protein SAMN04490243_1774 [Robiginitalea myxolifaciens]
MQKNLFLYLFVFSALIALYLAVSGNKSLEKANASNTRLSEQVETYKDSLKEARLEVLDMQYFNLENNDEALAYLEHLDLENPQRYIEDKLLETNEQRGNNVLVPYEGMNGDFKINKIKVLNHRWILCDFSDGKYWGELLVAYEIGEDLTVKFTTMDHLLYAR